MAQDNEYIRWFETLNSDDVAQVGGKNASLGEMISDLKDEGIRVPDGFATTARAYRAYLDANDLNDDLRDLLGAWQRGERDLDETGEAVRDRFLEGRFPDDVADAIRSAYHELSARFDVDAVDVAIRSSATAEDLPEASFAGQQESFLNVTGDEDVLDACRRCYASLFTDRAITYREQQEFGHLDVALSVGVQKMVRSDEAGAGVMFTIDSDTGFPRTVLINAGWGLGESVVKGAITPDQYVVYKPLLDDERLRPIIGKTLGRQEQKLIYADDGEAPTQSVDTTEDERQRYVLDDDEILQLARWAVVIESHYGHAMDIEWAKDGESGETYIVQARPETVQSQKERGSLKTYKLKERGERLVTGLSIGQAISAGEACIVRDPEERDQFREGDILVTDKTDPDWVPVMKQAAGIVTNHGGRTSHAAIVSRELGIPAVIGTENATDVLKDGQEVTLSCAEGEEGYIYDGILDFEEREVDLEDVPETTTRIMMNVASPAAALQWWQLPVRGIGLARMEYIVNNVIKIHPMALVHFDTLEDDDARDQIIELTKHYEDKTDYFVDNLARGIAMIAASQHPEPVVVRLSDFKTNEYADLIGGAAFEPEEANPMLGWRGASRYYSDDYRDGFELECRAIKQVRETMGFDNVIVMIPFCRTPEEADRVIETMESFGLKRGADDLQLYVMAEIPSNILQADEFADRFDGFSIGSNDLTQLVLGVDRDASNLSYLFDERNRSVKRMIEMLIRTAHDAGRSVGICGQAPSDYPDFAEFLVETGIDSISLNPDSVLGVLEHVAQAEAKRSAE